MRPLCWPKTDVAYRIQLHVTADDPRRQPNSPDDPLPYDRGIDEMAELEVRLLKKGDPRLKKMDQLPVPPNQQTTKAPRGKSEELEGYFIESGFPQTTLAVLSLTQLLRTFR